MGTGWYVNYTKIDELELYLPLSLMTAIIHFIIVGIGRINDDDPKKWHDYESIPGYIIVFIKIVLFIVFFYFTNKSATESK